MITFTELKTRTENFWADKGFYENVTIEAQCDKLVEESEETREAILYEDIESQMKEIGDVQTVLINICKLKGFDLNKCLEMAYNKNLNRTGRFIDGKYVKNEGK